MNQVRRKGLRKKQYFMPLPSYMTCASRSPENPPKILPVLQAILFLDGGILLLWESSNALISAFTNYLVVGGQHSEHCRQKELSPEGKIILY